jgi:hypothetical protein
MTETAASSLQTRGKRSYSTRNYERRLKAAGLDNDTVPDDADEFRNQLARRIHMAVNEWPGCPELLCQRNRGCMAPDNVCANMPPVTTEEMERDWPRVRAEIYKAVKEQVAEE